MADLPTEIFDSLPSGILAVDMENRLLFLNQSLAKRLGIDRDQWLGRPFNELLRMAERHLVSPEKIHLRLHWGAHAEEAFSQVIEWKEAEHILYLREDSSPLRDTSGQVVGRLFAYHDMSREKVIDRMKSEFISVASHELRTPMTSIKGSVDLILNGLAGEISAETQELLEIAQSSCNRLIRLINDILDLSKIEAGQVKLKLGPIDLAESVERAIRGMRSLAEQSEVTIRLEHPPNLPPVTADRDAIEQVLTNLLSNAIKFSPATGMIQVELSVDGDWVQCRVIDQGCGIREEDLAKVFGKFQQLGRSRRAGGSGLGLAIAQALVKEHRGRIWVESRPNSGARFSFVLPVSEVVAPDELSATSVE